MYHSDIKLKEGAFIVSDAHYSTSRPELLNFLKTIESKKQLPPQLILMGDIFDLLFGGIEKTLQRNKEVVKIINSLANKIEIIYLEGNHDFNLQDVFPNVKVFKISLQPLICEYESKKIILAHGDFDGALTYKIYTALIRNDLVLKFLNLFDEYILAKLDKYLGKKDDCKGLDWFEDFIKRRIGNNYECDYFIEGHFHQDKIIKLDNMEYINLGAFACNQRFFIVKSTKDKQFLREKNFSQGDINYG